MFRDQAMWLQSLTGIAGAREAQGPLPNPKAHTPWPWPCPYACLQRRLGPWKRLRKAGGAAWGGSQSQPSTTPLDGREGASATTTHLQPKASLTPRAWGPAVLAQRRWSPAWYWARPWAETRQKLPPILPQHGAASDPQKKLRKDAEERLMKLCSSRTSQEQEPLSDLQKTRKFLCLSRERQRQ